MALHHAGSVPPHGCDAAEGGQTSNWCANFAESVKFARQVTAISIFFDSVLFGFAMVSRRTPSFRFAEMLSGVDVAAHVQGAHVGAHPGARA